MSKPGQTDYLNLCEEYGFPCILYVYFFDVDPHLPDLLSPETLEAKHGVMDAVALQEYWLCNHIPRYGEKVYKVKKTLWFGDWLQKIYLTEDIDKSDFFLVDALKKYNTAHSANLQPNEVYPAIWEKMISILPKK